MTRRRNVAFALLLLLPALSFLLTLMGYPILQAIYMSFHRFSLTRLAQGTPFVGLENFKNVILDPLFLVVLKNTFKWVVGSVFFQLIFGLGVALLLNQDFKGRQFVRSVVLIPWVIPGVLAAGMWKWMYDPQMGVINRIISQIGLGIRPLWLSDPKLAIYSVLIVNIWKGFPFFAIMLLARLQAIPEEIFEAGLVDGVGVWQKFRHLTLPLLLPTIYICTLLRTIWVFNYVDIIYAMTGGGPANTTQTMATYTFLTAYTGLNFGKASALALVLMAILTFLAVLYFWSAQRAEVEL